MLKNNFLLTITKQIIIVIGLDIINYLLEKIIIIKTKNTNYFPSKINLITALINNRKIENFLAFTQKVLIIIIAVIRLLDFKLKFIYMTFVSYFYLKYLTLFLTRLILYQLIFLALFQLIIFLIQYFKLLQHPIKFQLRLL